MRWQDEYTTPLVKTGDGKIITKCDECRKLYAEPPASDPPCGSCRVELWAENKEPGIIFMLCRRQVIATMGKLIDINIQAVKTVMDIYGIVDQRCCLEKVLYTFQATRKT